MNFQKYTNRQVIHFLKHNRREYTANQMDKIDNNSQTKNTPGASSIDSKLTPKNYSIISRGDTAKEINDYRLEREKEIYKLNRKGLIHALEYVIQAPSNCPPELEPKFFEETVKFIASTLPLKERAIIDATVHVDEVYRTPDGKVISKHHLHCMCIPAVEDKKHENYDYKLCCDELTKRKKLKDFYPKLQAHLDKAGVHVTVYNKNSSGAIRLTANQLKAITKETGVTIQRSLKTNDIIELLSHNIDLKKELENTISKEDFKKVIEINEQLTSSLEIAKSEALTYQNQALKLQHELELEKEKTKTYEAEMNELKEQVIFTEKNKEITPEWGQDPEWGSSKEWGTISFDDTITFGN